MTRSAGFIDRVRDSRYLGAALVSTAYIAVVVWAAVYHEPWADEVVPLSIARNARSLSDLAAPLKFEGHPILWYLLLWTGYHLVGRTWVLKVASIGSAAGALVLFNGSRLPWWLRCLFTFSFFPVYQYAVISRGYSLEMLALFGFCALYPRRREHPLGIAFVLAALANTEAFGFIMAVAAAAMMIAETVTETRDWRTLISDRWLTCAVAVFLSGLALAAAVASPGAGHPLTGFRQLDLWGIAVGVGRAIAQPAAHMAAYTVVPAPSVWVWAYFAYLTQKPSLLCFTAVALIGIETLFNLVYGAGHPWHVGNEELVLVAAMWLDASGTIPFHRFPGPVEHARLWLGRVLLVGVTITFASQVVGAARFVAADFQYDYSSNRRLAELLRSDPTLSTAVVMGEPDTSIWSLPYWADNRIFLPREGTFRAWGMFAPWRQLTYDLGALLDAARNVRTEYGSPVVITLGIEVEGSGTRTYTNRPGTKFEEKFLATADQQAEFRAATRLLARLRGPTISDERYDVYVLR